MAKETVKVDNGLEEIKLVKNDDIKNVKKDKKNKKAKEKNAEKNTAKKQGFLKSVRSEMKLVTWASKKTVVKYSFATIAMIVLMALFFIGLTALFDLLYNLVQGWIA
ncbi:MAG: preprotein translocase subunit SecE [Bacilli bacterium]|nr:preprotein translocase subunit SecE [Bacilli bacterium]